MKTDPKWTPPETIAVREILAAAMAVLTTRCLAGLSTTAQDLADACLISRADAEQLLQVCGQEARERCEAACARIRQGIG